MSGLINSAGSKSGIIGSTEIPGGYEEGAWTPTGAGGFISLTISGTGSYTKIGNIIFLRGLFTINGTGTGSGDFSIAGLPYTTTSNGSYRSSISCYWSNLASAVSEVTGFIQDASKYLYFREGSTTGEGADLGAHIDSGSYFFLSANYQVDS